MLQLLVIIIILLLAIPTILIFRSKKVNSRDIEGAVSSNWVRSGLEKKYTRLALHTQDSRDSHKTIKQMLRVPIERAALREIHLKTILSTQLPHNMFDIRKSMPGENTTNVYFSSTIGIICIDSKFSPGNYHKWRITS